jgi:putative ABC transport system permease protein
MTPRFLKRISQKIDFEAPLSWSQLSHQKVRLIVATTGVCFANILMFTQLGLQSMLTEGTTLLHETLDGELILSSAFSPSLQFGITFPRAYLLQSAATEGVATASPLYINIANWVNPREFGKPEADAPEEIQPIDLDDLFGNQVRVLAFNPAQPVFNLPEVNQQLGLLGAPGSVLFDRLGQPSLGEVPALLTQQKEVPTVMGNRRTYAVGLFSLGSTLFAKGNVIMSDWNYSQRGNDLNSVTVGVLKLEPGANVEAVKAKLRASLPEEVSILTKAEFIEQENQYQDSEPNGVILKFGTIVGFVVGIIIVYQVLYADINDHLSEYATLKAMGYADRALLFVILQEGIVLAVLGFIPGFFASVGIYNLLTVLTRIPLAMKAGVAIQVFILTLIMCALSGAIASSRLRSADPADVF